MSGCPSTSWTSARRGRAGSVEGVELSSFGGNTREHPMKKVLGLALLLLLLHSSARAELMVVDLKVIKAKAGGWRYEVVEGDKKEFPSDAALGDYLKRQANHR